MSGGCACSARGLSWGWTAHLPRLPALQRSVGWRATNHGWPAPFVTRRPRTRDRRMTRLSQRTNRPTAKPLKVCLPRRCWTALTLSSRPDLILTLAALPHPVLYRYARSRSTLAVTPGQPWPLSTITPHTPPALVATRRLASALLVPVNDLHRASISPQRSRLPSPQPPSLLDLILPSSTTSCSTASSPTHLNVPALRSQHRLPRSRPRSSTTTTSECGRSDERGCHVDSVA